MDLMNSDIIKGAVGLLTGLIETLNKVSSFFGEGSGLFKVGIILGALALADKAVTIFRNSLRGTAEEGGKINTVFSSIGAVGKAAASSLANGFTSLPDKIRSSTLHAIKL
jgi:hypothetical protein